MKNLIHTRKFIFYFIVTLAVTLVIGPQSLRAFDFPGSCQEIREADPTALDGEYLIFHNNQVFSVYCYDMEVLPEEYLTLENTGGPFNFSEYYASCQCPGTDVITHYTKLRIDPETLLIDIGDQTFSTSEGSLDHCGSTTVTSMPYGVAMACVGACYNISIANIDLTGTPFAVADDFSVGGFLAYGTATFSPDNQVVDLTGGGFCGWIVPAAPEPDTLTNPFNAKGGFRLNLEYTGPMLVPIDIKPGKEQNYIKINSKGRIRVALLTDETFDATEVDPATVLFGATGTEAVPVRYVMRDIDRDGDVDVIFIFRKPETNIQCGDTLGILTGNISGGQAIEGVDSIHIVGCK